MQSEAQQQAFRAPQSIGVSSPEFENGRQIPREFTAHGDDVSPPLRWTGVPNGAQSIAIVVDDPDAPKGTFTHWLVWNLRPDLNELVSGVDLPGIGASVGQNDFGRAGYNGPKPPSGTHRYFFRVFALSKPIGPPGNARADEVWREIGPNVLAWGELMGTFTKP